MKSKDEIIDELGIPDLINDTREYDGCVDWENHRSALSAIHTAMQTYHDEGCVEFHNWAEIYVETTPLESKVPTTQELLKLWKDEKGIV